MTDSDGRDSSGEGEKRVVVTRIVKKKEDTNPIIPIDWTNIYPGPPPFSFSFDFIVSF